MTPSPADAASKPDADRFILPGAMAAVTFLFAAILFVSLVRVDQRTAALVEARRFRASGAYEKAARLYEEVLATAPDLPTPHLELAGVYLSLDAAGATRAEGSYLADAIKEYTACIMLDPSNLAARHGLVAIFLDLADRRENAAKAFLAGDQTAAAAERTAKARQALETARDVLLEAGTIDSDDSLTQFLLAEVYERLGQQTQASTIYAGLVYDPGYGEQARERQAALAASFLATP